MDGFESFIEAEGEDYSKAPLVREKKLIFYSRFNDFARCSRENPKMGVKACLLCLFWSRKTFRSVSPSLSPSLSFLQFAMFVRAVKQM